MQLIKIPLLLVLSLTLTLESISADPFFYVGSHEIDNDTPISLCKLDEATGKVSLVNHFGGVKGSSYLCLSPNRKYLYTVAAGTPSRVTAWQVNLKTGNLTFINGQSAVGQGACHLSTSRDGELLFVANYNSGSLSVLPIADDGSLLASTQQFQFTGSGPNKGRQESPHAHYVNSSLDGKWVFVADLGTDRIRIFEYNSTSGKLSENTAFPYYSSAAAAGPRHLDFHPNGKWIYLINELNGSVDALELNHETGELKKISTHSALPKHFNGYNKSAAIRMHPSGNYLYASNREDSDSITGFSIDANGDLKSVEYLEEHVVYPRDFNIDPTGRYLIVGNRNRDELRVFAIDSTTGNLSDTGNSLDSPKPVCILFL